MKIINRLLLVLFVCSNVFAGIDRGQELYEKSINAVVRDKIYYKKGHLELGLVAGLLPYDSLVNSYLLGGRLTWHLSDHYGWEILDGLYSLGAVSTYATNTAQEKSINNLQLNLTRMSFCTGFLISPFYGKIKFLGDQSLYFDIYLLIGAGLAMTDTIQLSSNNQSVPTVTTLTTTWDPTVPLGFGFKIFLNQGFGLVIDFRDYISISNLYGGKVLRSNFSFFLGLNIFLPNFG